MKFIIIASTFLITNMASASYFRFWRGQVKPTVSYNDFHAGLNSIFVPATGKLKASVAKLSSYHPFLVSEVMSKSEGLPTEIALIEYESESSYQSFRSTPEGKQYGELHWDYFDKESSKSLVPKPYVGQLEFENAYSFSKSPNPSFLNGIPFIQIVKRTEVLTDSQWKDCIRGHLDYIAGKNVESVIFLVTQNYVIEYAIWNSIKEKEESDDNTATTHVDPQRGPTDVINDYLVELGIVSINQQLKAGHLLSPNSGIRFQ